MGNDKDVESRIFKLQDRKKQRLDEIDQDIPKTVNIGRLPLVHKNSQPKLLERVQNAETLSVQAKVYVELADSQLAGSISPEARKVYITNMADLVLKKDDVRGKIQDRKPTRVESTGRATSKILGIAPISNAIKGFLKGG